MKKTKLVTVNVAAKTLGIDASQLRRESKEKPGFPVHSTAAGDRVNVEEVRRWRRGHVPARMRMATKKKASLIPTPAPAAAVAPGPRPEASAVESAREILAAGTGTGVQIARAAVVLASAEILKDINPFALDALKKALGELRLAEADYLELERNRGNMVDRVLVRDLCGLLASRLVRCVGVLENAIASEFAVWMGDPAIGEMEAGDRAKMVREFVRKTCDEVRTTEADGVDKLIDDAIADS